MAPDGHRHLAGAVHAARSGHQRRADPPLRGRRRRYWASAWGTSASARRSARRSTAPARSCTASCRRSTTTARASFAACPTRSRRDAITRWPFAATACRTCLEVSAWTDKRRSSWALRHRELVVEGVQFHPESILTAAGKDLLRNFLELVRRGSGDA